MEEMETTKNELLNSKDMKMWFMILNCLKEEYYPVVDLQSIFKLEKYL